MFRSKGINATVLAVLCLLLFQGPTLARDVTLKSAVDLFKKEKYDDSLKQLLEVLKKNPSDYRAYYFAGRCYETLGDRKNACRCYYSAMVLGYKTNVYNRTATYLQKLDKRLYFKAVVEAQKRHHQLKNKKNLSNPTNPNPNSNSGTSTEKSTNSDLEEETSSK